MKHQKCMECLLFFFIISATSLVYSITNELRPALRGRQKEVASRVKITTRRILMPPCPDCNVTRPDIRSCGYIDKENKSTLDWAAQPALFYGKIFCDNSYDRCTSDEDCTGIGLNFTCLEECGPQL